MKKKRKDHARRLDRLERKCDCILTELVMLRQRLSRRGAIDDAIDSLHVTARKLRSQSILEREKARKDLQADEQWT